MKIIDRIISVVLILIVSNSAYPQLVNIGDKDDRFDWIQTARVFLLDAYQPPFAPELEYDAKDLVDAMVDMNANVVRFSTMGKYSTIQGIRFSTHPEQGDRDLLSETIEDSTQPRIGGMAMTVHRNAYGRQVESFEADLQVTDTDWSRWDECAVHGVFIRAPIIVETAAECRVLINFEDRPVLVRQDKLLAATFHPELTGDPRIHDYFLSQVVQ